MGQGAHQGAVEDEEKEASAEEEAGGGAAGGGPAQTLRPQLAGAAAYRRRGCSRHHRQAQRRVCQRGAFFSPQYVLHLTFWREFTVFLWSTMDLYT